MTCDVMKCCPRRFARPAGARGARRAGRIAAFGQAAAPEKRAQAGVGCGLWLALLVVVSALVPAKLLAADLELKVLHSFQSGRDGQQPEAALVEGVDGALYGTTFLGGTNQAGTVFKVNPDGSGNTPLFQFPKNTTSPFGLADPSGLIQGADGGLYGTDGSGGSFGGGSVYRLNTDGSGFTILYSFNSRSNGGYDPSAALLQGSDGWLYGTTAGGGTGAAGTVFKLRANGTEFVELHSFGGVGDGQGPMAPLIQGTDGALYGTTVNGGASAIGEASGYGTVFKIGTDGSETVLHSFMPEGGDGQRPYGALIQARDGLLYGVTSEGGTTSSGGSTGSGTIFRLNLDGSGYEIVHHFDPAVDGDGKYPWAGLEIGNDGALYGTTPRGGTYDVGVLFRYRPANSAYAVLYTFGTGAADGQYPRSRLVRARHGGLFGTAPFGGDSNFGIIFRLAPAPVFLTSIRPGGDQSMKITLTGASSFEYLIEASAERRVWTTVTNVYNATGVMEVSDPQAPEHAQRFYRAAWVP